MTSDSSERGAPPLTAVERARLRPSVDGAALERWLIATNDELRVAMIANFATTVTDDDLRAIGRALGEDGDEWAEMLEGELDEPVLSPGELHVPGPDAPPGAVSFIPLSSRQNIVTMEPPDDPALAALWNAIEPSGEKSRGTDGENHGIEESNRR